jgi:hypothetical protein
LSLSNSPSPTSSCQAGGGFISVLFTATRFLRFATYCWPAGPFVWYTHPMLGGWG